MNMCTHLWCHNLGKNSWLLPGNVSVILCQILACSFWSLSGECKVIHISFLDIVQYQNHERYSTHGLIVPLHVWYNGVFICSYFCQQCRARKNRRKSKNLVRNDFGNRNEWRTKIKETEKGGKLNTFFKKKKRKEWTNITQFLVSQ